MPENYYPRHSADCLSDSADVEIAALRAEAEKLRKALEDLHAAATFGQPSPSELYAAEKALEAAIRARGHQEKSDG